MATVYLTCYSLSSDSVDESSLNPTGRVDCLSVWVFSGQSWSSPGLWEDGDTIRQMAFLVRFLCQRIWVILSNIHMQTQAFRSLLSLRHVAKLWMAH